jgi:hypothetical protein
MLLAALKFPAAITVVDVASPWTSLTLGIPGSAVAIPIPRRVRAIQKITSFFINLLLK